MRTFAWPALAGGNGHSCDIEGMAEAKDARLTMSVAAGPRSTCELSLRIESGSIRSQAGKDCDYFCGANMSLDEAAWPLDAKRVIRYMSKLKASRE